MPPIRIDNELQNTETASEFYQNYPREYRSLSQTSNENSERDLSPPSLDVFLPSPESDYGRNMGFCFSPLRVSPPLPLSSSSGISSADSSAFSLHSSAASAHQQQQAFCEGNKNVNETVVEPKAIENSCALEHAYRYTGFSPNENHKDIENCHVESTPLSHTDNESFETKSTVTRRRKRKNSKQLDSDSHLAERNLRRSMRLINNTCETPGNNGTKLQISTTPRRQLRERRVYQNAPKIEKESADNDIKKKKRRTAAIRIDNIKQEDGQQNTQEGNNEAASVATSTQQKSTMNGNMVCDSRPVVTSTSHSKKFQVSPSTSSSDFQQRKTRPSPKCSPLRISLIKAPPRPSSSLISNGHNSLKKRHFRSTLSDNDSATPAAANKEAPSDIVEPQVAQAASQQTSPDNCKREREPERETPRTLRLVSNWRPDTEGFFGTVRLTNDSLPTERLCYGAIRHKKVPTEVVHVGDCIKVHSAEGLENVGKVIALHYDEEEFNLMATVLWYYTQSQLDPKCVLPEPMDPKELLASKHLDTVNADCIEAIAYVLTFNEYCRFRAETALDQLPPSRRQLIEAAEICSRADENYPRRALLPHDDTPVEMVYFCRGIYSIRAKKIFTKAPPPYVRKDPKMALPSSENGTDKNGNGSPN